MPVAVSGDHDPGIREPSLGADVGRRRSHHPGERPIDLLPSPPPIARSDVEIPADLFRRHRTGAVGEFLRRRGRAVGRRGGHPSDGRPLDRARRPAQSPLAQGRVPSLPGRLWNQDGARPAAHLAARRSQRGSVRRVGAALRGAFELRVSDDSSGPFALVRGRPGGVQCRSSGVVRVDFDGRGGRLHPRPVRLQADAGLFQRRAHGHPFARDRHRRRGHLRRHVPHDQSLVDQGHVVPGGGQYPGVLRHQIDDPGSRRPANRARHRRALARRIPGHRRLPALRTVSERTDHSQGHVRRRPSGRGGRLPGVAGNRVCRNDDDLLAHGPGLAARREPLWSIAPVLALGLGVLVLGVYLPPRLADLLREAAAVLGAN